MINFICAPFHCLFALLRWLMPVLIAGCVGFGAFALFNWPGVLFVGCVYVYIYGGGPIVGSREKSENNQV